jgi:hypothetical protein
VETKGTLDEGNGPAVDKIVPIFVGTAMKTNATSKTKNKIKAGKIVL